MDLDSLNIISLICGSIAAIVYIFDYVFGKSINKLFRIVLVVIIISSAVFFTYALFRKRELIGVNSDPPKTDTSIRTGEGKPIKGSKSQNTQSSLLESKKKSEPTEIINESEKADFAIIAITNEKQDNQLARVFVNWLGKNGTSSQSILQNLFIEQGFFNQIIDGNSSVIKKTNAANAAKYICLVRAKVDYSKSEINDVLTVATCDYETVIIEASTGKIIDSFTIPAKSSGITKEAAKQRAESDFINELNKRKLTI